MEFKATTILGSVHNGNAAMGGDGQVTLGNTVVKHNASKIRRLADGKDLFGFVGGAAFALTLMERLYIKHE